MGGGKWGLFPIVIGGLLIGSIASVVYTITQGYGTVGGANQFTQVFDAFEMSLTSYNRLVSWISTDRTFSVSQFMALGWGATAGLLLTLAHHRFPWWPLHPIGFGVAQAFGTTFVVFSVFLSWFIKLLLLKIGMCCIRGRHTARRVPTICHTIASVHQSRLVALTFGRDCSRPSYLALGGSSICLCLSVKPSY